MQDAEIVEGLKNASLFLKPAYVFHDLIHILRRDGIDLRHVPELPVMGFHAIGSGSLKRRIAMMIRFIDLVNQRWALSSSDSPDAVTR
jgi:hypothetical protein